MMIRLGGLLASLILAGCASTQSPPPPAAEAPSVAPTWSPAPPRRAHRREHAARPAPAQSCEQRGARRRGARTDLWVRVRRGFMIPDLDGPLVEDRERWYASGPTTWRMTTPRSRYLFYIVEELERRGLPTEIALLPLCRERVQPASRCRAPGLGHVAVHGRDGKDYDLKQNLFRDDRRDVLASTRAALDHLTRLYAQFGDWQLALAAHNWGEGNVQRAIDRNPGRTACGLRARA